MSIASDKLQKLVQALPRSEWWDTKPNPRYVRRRDVLKKEHVQLLGFTIGVTSARPEPINSTTHEVLCGSREYLEKAEYIRVTGKVLSGSPARWIEHCRNVRYVHLRQCEIDSDTLAAFQLCSEVTCLILRDCEVRDAEALAGLPNVRVIKLVNTKAKAETLLDVRKHLPDSMLQAFTLDGEKFVPLLPAAAPIHRPDTQALARIRKAIKRMSTRMTEIGHTPNADIEGWDASDSERVEKAIGYQLPKDLRFVMSRETGQFDSIICLCPFQQSRDVIARTHSQHTLRWRLPGFAWRSLRDRRGRWHYPLVTFMGDDSQNVCLDLVTGEVVYKGEDEDVVLAENLGEFLEHFAHLLETKPLVDIDEDLGGGKGFELYSSDLHSKKSTWFGVK